MIDPCPQAPRIELPRPASFGEWDDERAPFHLPSKSSIARALLDAWLADVRSE